MSESGPTKLLPEERPLANQIVDLLRAPLKTASYALPLWMAYLSIRALAGERTILDVNVQMALAFSVIVSAAALSQWRRARGASARLEEQRERLERYERLNTELQQRNDRLEREIRELMDRRLANPSDVRDTLEPQRRMDES